MYHIMPGTIASVCGSAKFRLYTYIPPGRKYLPMLYLTTVQLAVQPLTVIKGGVILKKIIVLLNRFGGPKEGQEYLLKV